MPIIAKADVSRAVREKWLDRLWDALQEDDMPYLEYLGEYWGVLCTTPELAEYWADYLSPTLTTMWAHCARSGEYGYFKGTTACLSAMYSAGRYDELLALIAKSEYRHKSWHWRVFGAKALAKAGRWEDAIQYAEDSKGLNAPLPAIAAFCEGVLRDMGFADEAYSRYAVQSTFATTNFGLYSVLSGTLHGGGNVMLPNRVNFPTPSHIFYIANDAYCRLVGHRDLIGKNVREALPELEGQNFFEQLDEVYATGKPFFGHERQTLLQRQPNGVLEKRFVNFIYQPTLDHHGNVVGIFVEGSDVTESVEVRQALQKSETDLRTANRRKDEFLAMLAHELRNPLAPIATAAALLKRGALDEGRVRKATEVISRQVDHMTELVDDLLDVSRVTRGLVTLQEEPTNIISLLADASEQVGSLIEARQQHFTVQVPDEQLFVRGDRTRLIQVFSNILNNAAKYTPSNGNVKLAIVATGI